MAKFVLKKGSFTPVEDRRWLFECGHCHSDFLLSCSDFIHVTTDTKSYTYIICPVCGKNSIDIDPYWMDEGYIRSAEEFEGNVVSITDYDDTKLIYEFDSMNDIYELGEYIPGFKFRRRIECQKVNEK